MVDSFNSILASLKNKNDKIEIYKLHLELMLDYGINFKDRSITISSDIDVPLFDLIDSALTEMESQGKRKITIKINSFGGSAYSALAIIGRMQKTKNKGIQVITEGYGKVMSAATLILACGTKRYFSRYAVFMHHEASSSIDGTLTEMKDFTQQLEKEEKLWCEFMAEFSGKELDYWLSWVGRKDAYFFADELLKLGVIDEVF